MHQVCHSHVSTTLGWTPPGLISSYRWGRDGSEIWSNFPQVILLENRRCRTWIWSLLAPGPMVCPPPRPAQTSVPLWPSAKASIKRTTATSSLALSLRLRRRRFPYQNLCAQLAFSGCWLLAFALPLIPKSNMYCWFKCTPNFIVVRGF